MSLIRPTTIKCGSKAVPRRVQFTVIIDLPGLWPANLQQELQGELCSPVVTVDDLGLGAGWYRVTFAPEFEGLTLSVQEVMVALERIAGRVHDALEQQRALGMLRQEPEQEI